MTQAFRLPYTPPYDGTGLLAYLVGRAIPGVEAVSTRGYARTIALGGRHGRVTVRPGDGDVLLATIEHPDASVVPEVLARLRRLFDLDADPAAIEAGLSRDPTLAGLVAARPGLRVPGAWDGFELAVRAILGQQVSVAAATRLAGRLTAAFGTPLAAEAAHETNGLTHVFPTPEQLAGAEVAAALGMPGARGRAIGSLAAAILARPGLLDPGRGLAPAVDALKALPGIGDWTAHYIAMRALREPDALPPGDIALLRALDRGQGRPRPAALLERAEAWRPWRAYAALHLWASDAAASVPPSIGEQEPGCGTPRGRRKVVS